MAEHTASVVNEALRGKVNFTPECWTFTGKKTSKGYGVAYRNGGRPRAHRLVYEVVNGPIPDGATIGHSCGTNACVNPDHLVLKLNAIPKPVDVCQQCGADIPPDAPFGSRYCGDGCRRKARSARAKDANTPKEKLSAECFTCGSTIPGVHHKGHLPKYCSTGCRNDARRERKSKSRPQSAAFTIACAMCGTSFITPHSNAKYCGQYCRAAANRQKAREKYADDGAREALRQQRRDQYRRRTTSTHKVCQVCGDQLGLNRSKTCDKPDCIHQLKLERDRRYAATRVKDVTAPSRIFIAGTCSECGEQYVHERKNMSGAHLLTYCSDRCRDRAGRRRYKRRYGKFAVSDAQRLAIYERDDWTCQICHLPVERDGDPLGPGAPTLDHIEPQSMTLIPDHGEHNLRLACRQCNTDRQAKVTKAELRAVQAARRALLAA